MMGIHPNPPKQGNSNGMRFSPAPGSANPSLPKGWWICLSSKMSRFKVGLLVTVVVVLVLFGSYTVTTIFRTSNLVMAESTRSSFTTSSKHTEEFTDKIRFRKTKRRLPHCIIIGIRKAGTRALLTYLNLHPHIKTASDEIHFFDDDDNYSRGLEWYRKRMPYSFPEELTIEKTPAYFAKRIAPDRLYHMNSSIRLLLVVREPVDRTMSDYLQIILKKKASGLKTSPFDQMVLKRNGEVNTMYPPLVRSVYHMYMENWLRKFNISQFHIVDGDRMNKNPFVEMQAVETFLGLEHRITKDNFYFNESRGFFCLRNGTKEKCLAESKGRRHPPIDPAVTKKLKEFFKPYNERFFQFIGRRFDWD